MDTVAAGISEALPRRRTEYSVRQSATPRAKGTPYVRLFLLTIFAILVHGYHLGADDAAIYVPAIKRVADPRLYPFGSEFFMSHAHLSFFSDVVGGLAKATRMPADIAIFVAHLAGIFLLLIAGWKLMAACFRRDGARWGGVGLLAAMFRVPVAGTALVIMDPYLTARSLSTPATLFAVAGYLSGRRKTALLWLLITALLHPQMSVYGAGFLGCHWLGERFATGGKPESGLALLTIAPFPFEFRPAQGAAREALLSRTYFFAANWTWYEWAGVFAPLALLWWFSSLNPRGVKPEFRRLARTLVPFGLLFTIAGIVLGSSARLENYARLQPMRAFHLVYVVFFLLLGGLAAEYGLRRKVWRWLGLFVPLAVSMWLLQRNAFPSSPHVEWPGVADRSSWNAAFLWIRGHTPKDAVFAMDPDYMLRPGEDLHGFRAVAERSALADRVKDSGAVSLFPGLADEWKSEVDAQAGFPRFQVRDFQNLAKRFPVTWVVTRRPSPQGMACDYENQDLAVCRVAGR